MHLLPEKSGTTSGPSPSVPITQYLDTPSYLARLLDVSPPISRMSGPTSDSDYGASVDKGKWRELTRPPYDYTLKNVNVTNDCHDTQGWLEDELQQPLITESKRSPKNAHKVWIVLSAAMRANQFPLLAPTLTHFCDLVRLL